MRIKDAVQRNLERSRAIAAKRQEELDSVFEKQRKKEHDGAGEHEDEHDEDGAESSITGTSDGTGSLQRSRSRRRRRSSRLRPRRNRTRAYSSFDGEDLREGDDGHGDGRRGGRQLTRAARKKVSHKFFPRFINANAPTDLKLFWWVFGGGRKTGEGKGRAG